MKKVLFLIFAVRSWKVWNAIEMGVLANAYDRDRNASLQRAQLFKQARNLPQDAVFGLKVTMFFGVPDLNLIQVPNVNPNPPTNYRVSLHGIWPDFFDLQDPGLGLPQYNCGFDPQQAMAVQNRLIDNLKSFLELVIPGNQAACDNLRDLVFNQPTLQLMSTTIREADGVVQVNFQTAVNEFVKHFSCYYDHNDHFLPSSRATITNAVDACTAAIGNVQFNYGQGNIQVGQFPTDDVVFKRLQVHLARFFLLQRTFFMAEIERHDNAGIANLIGILHGAGPFAQPLTCDNFQNPIQVGEYFRGMRQGPQGNVCFIEYFRFFVEARRQII